MNEFIKCRVWFKISRKMKQTVSVCTSDRNSFDFFDYNYNCMKPKMFERHIKMIDCANHLRKNLRIKKVVNLFGEELLRKLFKFYTLIRKQIFSEKIF